ncbi:helix-turn-helix transcriptional regulator [Lentzea sp. NBRC 105346]|uniref:helix-turn-helix transcriptional regulator n=1 Tax=Lentzea sp. NBRC 105346 TaxID=3032205 RepID=UPI0024A0C7FC|nr:LuxR C-terminal-related transcriptional regulator [Lentzea sp. NBRC 105346]GLZ29295.1 helix-turn-helix transcriptional regulator [Lentzea sp. NBRC 105346]
MFVAVQAADPISGAGLTSHLASHHEVEVLPADRRADADVAVVAVDRLTAEVVTVLRRSAAAFGTPTVLVVNEISEAELLAAVECKVVAVVPRAAATGERLVRAVESAAAGGGVLPPQLLGELLRHVERVQREVLMPQGVNAAGLTGREIDVLRLVADGMDTGEIAQKLCYSERSVKHVISGVTTRLKLRNRSHAVAYAMRAGML